MWEAITEPQAIIISSLFTVIAAVIGVSLGGLIFGGRVNDLKGALDTSKEMIVSHEVSVNEKLSKILDRVTEVESQFRSTIEGIGQIRGSLVDIESNSSGPVIAPEQIDARDRLRTDWISVRDAIERMATDPAKDGRTRAKYARIDRRQYRQLLESIHDDYGVPNVSKFRRAIDIWQKYKNGRNSPTQDDLQEMSDIRNTVGHD
jgi:hypothetical protein